MKSANTPLKISSCQGGIALNRHHTARMLRKSERITKLVWSESDPSEIARRSRRIRDHRCNCSCQMCRNPRRSVLTPGAKCSTIQERRHNPGRDE